MLILWGGCLVNRHWPRTWAGTVIDESTQRPVSGATVALIWGTVWFVQMDGGEDFVSAVETVTDANGRFSLPAIPGFVLNPLRIFGRLPKTVIFKDGYTSTEGVGHLYGSGSPGWRFRTTIKILPCSSPLTKTTKYETWGVTFCYRPNGLWCTPREALPLMWQAVSNRSTSPCYKIPESAR